MDAAIVIPTYWAERHVSAHAPGAYDHATDLASDTPELERCLSSLDQVRHLPRVILLAVCPQAATADVALRVRRIAAAHPALNITVVTNIEAARVVDRVAELAPSGTGECVSLRGYGAIRNMGLAAAAIFGHDAVVFVDDDEVILSPDFMDRALYALGQQTRQGLPILAKSGFFYDEKGSPFAAETKADLSHRWWTKRPEFNKWMKRAMAGTRISRSNYVCGGCFAVHARAYAQVAFDPFITRGEDLDYLFNLRLYGFDVWFDNEWAVRHLPPKAERRAPRFMQDVYRWYYERAKLAYANSQNDLNPVTAASLMPYPGLWISDELDARVRKTAFARFMLSGERAGYGHIWRHGREEAQRYANDYAGAYFKLQSFWPSIIDGLWRDAALAQLLEGA